MKTTTEPAASQTRPSDRPAFPEDRDTLWLLTIGPVAWTVHFLACYLAAAVWCAKFGSVDGLGSYVAIVTGLTLLVIGWSAWRGWKRHRAADDNIPHDFDSPEDRHQFLGFASFLLAGLSALGTLFVAVVFVIVGSCD